MVSDRFSSGNCVSCRGHDPISGNPKSSSVVYYLLYFVFYTDQRSSSAAYTRPPLQHTGGYFKGCNLQPIPNELGAGENTTLQRGKRGGGRSSGGVEEEEKRKRNEKDGEDEKKKNHSIFKRSRYIVSCVCVCVRVRVCVC